MMFMKLYPYASKIPKMHYTREVHIPDDIVRYSTGTSKCLELKRVVLNKCRITNIYCSLLPDLVHLGISGLCDLRKSIVSSRVLFPRTSKMLLNNYIVYLIGTCAGIVWLLRNKPLQITSTVVMLLDQVNCAFFVQYFNK